MKFEILGKLKLVHNSGNNELMSVPDYVCYLARKQ